MNQYSGGYRFGMDGGGMGSNPVMGLIGEPVVPRLKKDKKPLDQPSGAGLLDALVTSGGYSAGDDNGRGDRYGEGDSPSASRGQQGYNSTPGAEVSPAGYSLGFSPGGALTAGASGFAKGGPAVGLLSGLFGGLSLNRTAPVSNASAAINVSPLGLNSGAVPGGPEDNQSGPLGQNSGAVPGGPEDNQGGGGAVSQANAGGMLGGLASGDIGFAKGGRVTHDRLMGPDPDGADDGYAALDAGENVTTSKASKYYGQDVMDAINGQKIDRASLRKLLKG